jgi:excinuclease ABC subunit C
MTMEQDRSKVGRRTVLKEKGKAASSRPGVYLMKAADESILYVGKARNLRKRIASYFNAPGRLDPKTAVLVAKIHDFDTIVTGTEKEALILEANLIRKHRPRYNINLKDDKRYPSLRLDMASTYPNLTIVRRIKKDGGRYFGPYSSAQAVRQTLKIIHKAFKLRKCSSKRFKNRVRPCLHFQMESCLAPCCFDIDPAQYADVVREVILFLKGRTPQLIQKIRQQMLAASGEQAYERAAALRDKIAALERTLEKQVTVINDFIDRDVIAASAAREMGLITLMTIRSGKLLGTSHFTFPECLIGNARLIGAFLQQYYAKAHFIPREILVSKMPEDADLLAGQLTAAKGRKVDILLPRRGPKAKLSRMALKNAENQLKDLAAVSAKDMETLARLQKRIKLRRIPIRIECFDNSNISGSDPVAAMVVFEKGRPAKSEYRKYRIRTVTEHNDYAYMAEILARRFRKTAKDQIPDSGEASHLPDLLMVDGGRGQLGIAMAVIRDLGIQGAFDVIGIAKKDECKGETQDKIYAPGRTNPLGFGKEQDLLLFLQRIRDESHRFAISFHRRSREKRSLQSALDKVPGVGKKRKAQLFETFGSIEKIRTATLEELSALPGISEKVARLIVKNLR